MHIKNSEKYLSIAKLFNALNHYQLNYAYNGDFTVDLTERILSLAETDMDIENEVIKTKKKIYFIIVETLQNITRHQSTSEEANLVDGFFSIHKFLGGYVIGSGNTIANKYIPDLSKRLEKVNSLSPDELKEYQREVLSASGFSEKGGAGLGIIEMVRKSGNKIIYDFEKLDDQNSYFYYQSRVTNADVAVNVPEVFNYDVVKHVHKIIIDNHLKIFFQGQFKHDNVRSLLTMAESSVYLKGNLTFKKTSLSVMIELLQNICYHSVGLENNDERPGLFMVSDNYSICSLITGNYIENSKLAEVLKKLEFVNSLDNNEIEKIYLSTIVLEQNEHKKGAGLGFIDIRIKTKNKIEVELVPYKNNKTFIILKANISY